MTLRLFKSLFQLDVRRNAPFITFSSINGSMVSYPELNDLKDYKDRLIWVRVPKTPGHPYRYMPPVFWSKPNRRETYDLDRVLTFSRRERHAFVCFCRPSGSRLPTGWIPHGTVIQREVCLALAGLSTCVTPGILFASSKGKFRRNEF